jgi:hypothetical protein
MIRFLAGLFIGGTLAVAAYIELSARRGVAAGPPWQMERLSPYRLARLNMDKPAFHQRGCPCHVHPTQRDPGTIYACLCNGVPFWDTSDDWATDPRTAELATGGGR